MGKVNKVAAIAIMSLSLLGAIPVGASANYSDNNNTRYFRSYNDDDYRSLSRRYDRFGDRRMIMSYESMVQIMTNSDYFRNRDFMFRNRYQDNLPSVLGARNFVIEDRSDDRRIITIRNYNTGPFSVNRTTVRVNSDIFDRISRDIDIDQDIDIVVNTGDNTISFNTRTGSISTGDVDISIR